MWKRSPVPFLKGKKPLVMAHRGDSVNVPENTFQSIKDAFDLRVDVIEADLRITKDEEIVFFHDATINRTTNGRGFVKSYTLKEVKMFEQGYNFQGVGEFKKTYPFRGAGFQIQSVDDILTLFPKMRFNMDIKDVDPKAPEILAKKLKKFDAESRVMVGSFHTKQLERFREMSGAPTSAGPSEVWHFRQRVKKWMKKNVNKPLGDVKYLEQEEILGFPLPYFALQIPEKIFLLKIFRGPRFFQIAHLLNIAIHVWTVNEPGDMFRLLDWGVDGIFSDNPKLLKEIVDFKFRKK
ncbi:MAG: glycerophosphodiester phosphodiesterase [Candidatus Heimdallarchaeaceae archaeon]